MFTLWALPRFGKPGSAAAVVGGGGEDVAVVVVGVVVEVEVVVVIAVVVVVVVVSLFQLCSHCGPCLDLVNRAPPQQHFHQHMI